MASNKKFGLFFSILFFLISLISLIFAKSNFYFFLFFSFFLVFLTLSFLKPDWLFYLNLGWFKIGLFLGKIISPILIGLVYYLVITPVGLTRKLIVKSNINFRKNKRHKNVQSYWENCDNINFNPKDLF